MLLPHSEAAGPHGASADIFATRIVRSKGKNSSSGPTSLERLCEFSEAEPPAGETIQLLCDDHAGTYLVPSLCQWTANG
jgi:hypothetical protein